MTQFPPLTTREKVSYGVGDLAHGLAVATTAFWLLYYLTEVAGLEPALAALAIMLGRAWDAVTDPVMGWIVDGTKTRWGKCRPYLLWGSLVYALGFFLLWTVPEFDSQLGRFLYFTAVFIFFNTALTVVFIPYTSLTAALTSSYHDRTSLTSYRIIIGQIGFLVGAGLPPVIAQWAMSASGIAWLDGVGVQALLGDWAGTRRAGYLICGAFFGLLIAVSTLATFFGTTEREEPESLDRSARGSPLRYIVEIVRLIRSSQAYRVAVSVKLLSTCAIAVIASTLAFYIEFVLERPGEKATITSALLLTAILSTPLWTMFSRSHGKVETYRVAVGGYLVVLASLAVLPFLPGWGVYLLAIGAGIFQSAAQLIPWSMIPDVVEADELEQGHRREGLLYGGAAFTYKLGTALAIQFVGIALQIVGFEPGVNQSSLSWWGIVGVIVVLPSLLFALSIVASRRYLLTATRHAEIVALLAARRSNNAVS